MNVCRIISRFAGYLLCGTVLSFFIAEVCAIRAGDSDRDLIWVNRSTEDGGTTWRDPTDMLRKVVLLPHVEECAVRLSEIADPKRTFSSPMMRQEVRVTDDWGVTTERLSMQFRGGWIIVTRSTSGWPFRCAAGFLVRDVMPDRVIRETTVSAGPFQSAGRYDVPGAFLIQPLVPGALLNSVFYAAMLWLGVCGASTARRHLRRSRNRCLACNYDRSGLPSEAACPECGTAI